MNDAVSSEEVYSYYVSMDACEIRSSLCIFIALLSLLLSTRCMLYRSLVAAVLAKWRYENA
jgi:hypothetical protein